MIDGNDRRRQRCSFDIGRTIGLSEADGSHDELVTKQYYDGYYDGIEFSLGCLTSSGG